MDRYSTQQMTSVVWLIAEYSTYIRCSVDRSLLIMSTVTRMDSHAGSIYHHPSPTQRKPFRSSAWENISVHDTVRQQPSCLVSMVQGFVPYNSVVGDHIWAIDQREIQTSDRKSKRNE
eukprot:scaffold5357_cov208-Amphora_coffeaeformis.AAC.26